MQSSSVDEQNFAFNASDFEQVRQRLKRIAGISLGDSKDSMVYSRLARRIRALGLDSVNSYLATLDSDPKEHQEFINALTTNLTYFFREQHHFDDLAKYLRTRKNTETTIWCAASSTGEEPYSIAMTAVQALGGFDIPVKIIASDINSSVLEKASQGIYSLEQLEPLSNSLCRQFFLRGKNQHKGLVKVVPELKPLVTFKQINLNDKVWTLPKTIDIIFCRNVMIYFDKHTQREILTRMITRMHSKTRYYAGHSENLSHCSDLLRPLGKTVYSPVASR